MVPDLPQGAGYAVIIGLGIFFAVLMNLITWVQNRYTKYNSNNADEFTTASRNLPFGLICCGILSSWTWSLTLLQSATESYNLGVCGSYYYAIGGLAQVSVFSIIASQVKANANLVTTFPEMGFFRFGTPGHLAFLWCAFVCNSIVSACILLGGSAVVHAVSGVNYYASIWLIPAVCAIYVFLGGLRATFIADATHTLILLIFIIIFSFVVYTNSAIGSPGEMVRLLTELVKTKPIADNYHGSYLTFRSKNGAIFSVQSVITGFGLVICDQSYWSRAVAADSKKTSSAYFFASIGWFIIPTTMGLTLGLGARALSIYPDFPSLSSSEVGAGLAAVATAQYILGKAGSVMILLMVFLSVTSSLSGELIASSTLLGYDVFKKYIKPDATPKQVVNAAKISVFIWSIYASALASIFYAIGISMGWLFNFLGVATASGVFPIALSFLYKDLNVYGAVGGSVGGMILALVVWLVTCKGIEGEITVANLSTTFVSFAGNAAAIVLGGVISYTCSLIKPANFDFSKTRNRTVLASEIELKKAEQDFVERADETQDIEIDNIHFDDKNKSKTKDEFELNENSSTKNHSDTESFESENDLPEIDNNIDIEFLNNQTRKYKYLSTILLVIFLFIIPIPLSCAPYIFSKGFLTGVVVIMFIWLFFTFGLVIIYPLYEQRKELTTIIKDLFQGEHRHPTHHDESHPNHHQVHLNKDTV